MTTPLLPTVLTMPCQATRDMGGDWPCPVTFTYEARLPGDITHDNLMLLALREAKAAGWKITQDHGGHIATVCPGQGDQPRLPKDLLS